MLSSAEGEAGVSLLALHLPCLPVFPLKLMSDQVPDLKGFQFWLEFQNNVNGGEIKWKKWGEMIENGETIHWISIWQSEKCPKIDTVGLKCKSCVCHLLS